MLARHRNWRKLLSYGEVVCFASAWLVALAMALSAERHVEDRGAVRTLVISTDISGMQARR